MNLYLGNRYFELAFVREFRLDLDGYGLSGRGLDHHFEVVHVLRGVPVELLDFIQVGQLQFGRDAVGSDGERLGPTFRYCGLWVYAPPGDSRRSRHRRLGNS